MEIITILAMITLIIVIAAVVSEHKKKELLKDLWRVLKEENRKQSDALRQKGITIDRLVKDLAEYQRKEETKTGECVKGTELNKQGKQFYYSFKKAFPGFSALIEVEAFVNKLVMDSDLPKEMKLEVLKIIKRELEKYRE